MSIALECANGWVLDHSKFIKQAYRNVHHQTITIKEKSKNYCFDSSLFQIVTPFFCDIESLRKNSSRPDCKRRKRDHTRNQLLSIDDHPEVCAVRSSLKCIISLAKQNTLFMALPQDSDFAQNNKEARILSTSYFEGIDQEKLVKCNGGNSCNSPLVVSIFEKDYLIPNNSKFYCCDVFELNQSLDECSTFDFILMDPPWWNKYVRRRKTRKNAGSYQMMYNDEVCSLPIASWLSASALVAVWCTNCAQHEQDIVSKWFPKWGLDHVATWYWVKVTKSGEPVCQFSLPPGKQPYERIVFGATRGHAPMPPDGRLIVSVPSAIHSHKPPLSDVLRPYLPKEPCCLELFARYMLPNWTSAGDQVLTLQNMELYTENPLIDS